MVFLIYRGCQLLGQTRVVYSPIAIVDAVDEIEARHEARKLFSGLFDTTQSQFRVVVADRCSEEEVSMAEAFMEEHQLYSDPFEDAEVFGGAEIRSESVLDEDGKIRYYRKKF